MRHARLLFTVAALWNISAAAVALLAPDYHRAMFFGPTADAGGPVGLVNTQVFWVSVLFFGLGYGMVARDPAKNHGLVLVAALGKIWVFLAWSSAWLEGEMTNFAMVGAVGDLVFAVLFMWFLVVGRRANNPGR